MKQVFLLCLFALLAWSFMFSAWTKDLFNFWILMSLSSGTLAGAALFLNRKNEYNLFAFKKSHLFIGIASALLLYLIFLIGKNVSTYLFSFASSQIESIYSNRESASPLMIGVLLFFLIAPAEEIFWRGFVQLKLTHRFGENKGWIYGSLIYAGIHIGSLNFILILTALICGLVWGYLFKKYKVLWPGLISHAVADLLLFVILSIK